MLVEAPVGNLCELGSSASGGLIDWLDLTWQQLAARASRVRSRGGRDARLLLRLGVVLKHEDVLWHEPDGTVVAVNVLPSQVIVARPIDMAQAAAIAFELGNLHSPMQFADGLIITPDDGPAQGAFEKAGAAFEIEIRRFEPTHRGAVQLTVAGTFEVVRKR